MKNLSFFLAFVALCSVSQAVNVQVFHAVAGGPAIDVYFDGELYFSEIPFGEITGYSALPDSYWYSDDITVEITVTGTMDVLVSQQVSTNFVSKYMTIAVIGSLDNPEDYPLTLFTAIDESNPTAGRSDLRVFNLAPGSSAIDVVSNGQVWFSDVSYAEEEYWDFFSTPYQTVESNVPYRVTIRNTGSSSVLAGPTIVNLAPSSANTLFIIGSIGGEFSVLNLEVTRDFVIGQVSSSASPTGSITASRTSSRSLSPSPSITPTRSFNTTASPSPTISLSSSLSTLPTRTPFRTAFSDDDDGGYTPVPTPTSTVVRQRSATIVRTRVPSVLVEPPYDYLTSDELYVDDEDSTSSPTPIPRPSAFLSRTIRFVGVSSDDATLTLVVADDDDSSSMTLSLSLALTFVIALIVFLQ